jgi:kinesin family protein 3/17
MSSACESVKIAVRLCPLSFRESKYREIIDIDQGTASAYITNPQGTKVQFTYDFAFPPACTQEEIYELTSAPIVDGALQGFNGTIFAYGQTGTGKTHTMDGAEEGDNRGSLNAVGST